MNEISTRSEKDVNAAMIPSRFSNPHLKYKNFHDLDTKVVIMGE